MPNSLDRVQKEAKTGLCTRQERAADAVKAGLRRFPEGVLPDADDFPSLPAELAGDAPIAGNVVFAFSIPKLPVGFGAGVALGATALQLDSARYLIHFGWNSIL